MKLIKTSTVPASLCDAEVKLSLTGAFEIVEDLVTEMMGKQHIDGVTCMREYGAMWVFVRNHLEMPGVLRWMDAYTAECYISSFSLLKLNVDSVIRNEEGEIVLFSRIELCAVDLETMKIRKSWTVGLGEATPPEETEIDVSFSREKYVPGKLLETVTVRTADIDYCHHCNNVSYIRFLENQWPVDELLAHPVRMIEVQYANQTHEGDSLEIYRCTTPDGAESSADEPASESFPCRRLYTILYDKKPAVNIITERA